MQYNKNTKRACYRSVLPLQCKYLNKVVLVAYFTYLLVLWTRAENNLDAEVSRRDGRDTPHRALLSAWARPPAPLTRPSFSPQPSSQTRAGPALSPLPQKPADNQSNGAGFQPEPRARQERALLCLWREPFNYPRCTAVWETSYHWCNEYQVPNFIARLPIYNRSHQQLQLTGTRLKQHDLRNLDQTSYGLPWIKRSAPSFSQTPS